MTDRLYFEEGHHKDFAAIIEREASVTGVTPNGDREYYGFDEVTKVIQGVERYAAANMAEPDTPLPGQLSDDTAATDSPSQATEADATDDTTQPSTPASNGRQRLQQAMLDAGIDLDNVSVLHVPSDEVYRIELEDGIDDYDAIDAWTDSRFGKNKLGYIDWTEYEKDDGSTGYYPDAYCVPYDALEDVVG